MDHLRQMYVWKPLPRPETHFQAFERYINFSSPLCEKEEMRCELSELRVKRARRAIRNSLRF